MIKVMVVDDQAILTEGMKMILSMDPALEVVALAHNGKEAIERAHSHKPDVVLMDIRMPVMDGIEATRQIKKDFPDMKVLLLTTFNEEDFIFNGFLEGASGYLLKDSSPAKIIEAIKDIFEGGTVIHPDVATKFVGQMRHTQKTKLPDDLTEREIDIIRLVGEGLNNTEIGEKLFISEGTVKNHMTRILDKLSMRDRTQLAIFAVKNL